MSSYTFIDTDDDFQSCVTSMEFEETKREPDDSDMIVYTNGIINDTLRSSKGHICIIPNWGSSYKFSSKYIDYVMHISSIGKLTKYKSIVDGCAIQIIREPPMNNVFNVILSINENITSRKMPSYKGFFKGYTMKTNPQFTESMKSTRNILFNNVLQLWKTGNSKYSLDYKYDNQEFHITEDIAFAVATTMFHDNE